jgi:hypothetical protein
MPSEARDAIVRRVKLSDWLNEYRQFSPDDVRPVGASSDDWQEPELLAPTDRVRDTTPRWLDRAARIGHARATQI